MSLEPVIKSMIVDSPPGDKSIIIKDLINILNSSNSSSSDTLIVKIFKDFFINRDYKLVPYKDDYLIISSVNLEGLKFIDYENNLKFDYDFKNNKLLDVEDSSNSDESVKGLNTQLRDYLNNHYPNDTKSSIVVKDGNDYKFLIVDEFLNDANYYNGKWISEYSYDSSTKKLSGQIKVKIHYYEDGNVVLNFQKELKDETSSIGDVISTINKFEDSVELMILTKFNKLNENLFKNLRRLLPVSKSKIKWGSAIGGYRLGQDVVNN